jgi:hypothetical protein
MFGYLGVRSRYALTFLCILHVATSSSKLTFENYIESGEADGVFRAALNSLNTAKLLVVLLYGPINSIYSRCRDNSIMQVRLPRLADYPHPCSSHLSPQLLPVP